jgi:group I intron endonuclease
MGFIYKIVNTDNDKVYIGQTRKKLATRWYGHKKAIEGGKGCPLLARAFNSHGVEKFSIELVEECENDKLCEREVFYIKEFNSLAPHGYNADAGGKMGGTFKGHTHTPETIERWREKVKDQYASPEYKKMRSELTKAYYSNPENRKKQSQRMKEVANSLEHGHKFRLINDETKEKIRESVNKYYAECCITEDRKEAHSKIMSKVNGRKIGRYSDTGNLISSYNTITEAAKTYNVVTGTIWAYLNKGRKDKEGYIWKYLDEGSDVANRLKQRKVDKEKLSQALTKANGRIVNQYSLTGKLIATYNSIIEAKVATNIDSSHISAVARGKGQTAGGFIWKYA